MAYDPRDAIWNKVYETYYESYYYEIVADKLVDRWQFTDAVTKVIVAITASGSTVSGWALWQDADFKIMWAGMAGVAALLSVIHASLGVTGKIKDWEDFKRSFVTLRVRLETNRHQMEINPNFHIEEFTSEYTNIRTQFGELLSRQKNDILRTRKLRLRAQDEVDAKLKLTPLSS